MKDYPRQHRTKPQNVFIVIVGQVLLAAYTKREDAEAHVSKIKEGRSYCFKNLGLSFEGEVYFTELQLN